MSETQGDYVTKRRDLPTSTDTDDLERERDEARTWARALLARCKNLEWLVERIGASWNEDVAELDKARRRKAEKEQSRIPATFTYFGPEHHCGDCGTELQIVRPGKWQCPECE